MQKSYCFQLICSLIVGFSFFVSSCEEAKVKEKSLVPLQSQNKDTISFSYGNIIAKVKCLSDSNQSYSLYLPSSYSKAKLWPVVYFFDSHANGNLPIEKYKSLADKYGYIIAASNNSKNGQSQELHDILTGTFLNDLLSRFSIDKKRMYTAGFSGGARVAVSAALTHAEIDGVIGCGAGFPSMKEAIQHPFEYISIVGDEDFNYTELNQLDALLEKNGVPHQMLLFAGKHEWPPLEYMEQAILWLDLNAMREGRRNLDKELSIVIKNKIDKEISVAEKTNDLWQLYYLCQKAVSYLHDLDDISLYESKISALKVTGKLQEVLQHKAELTNWETQLQQQYNQSFTNKNWNWWDLEISKINKLSKDKESKKGIIYKRLLSYLSLVAYMYSSNSLQSNNLEVAELYLKIYEKVDPQNSEYAYLFAHLYIKQNLSQKAISYLQKSIQLGFKDKDRLINDVIFNPIKNQPAFLEILSSLK